MCVTFTEISQPVVSDYERGALRPCGEIIVQLVHISPASADEILRLTPVSKRRGPQTRSFARRLKPIEEIPRRDQQVLLRTIGASLAKGA